MASDTMRTKLLSDKDTEEASVDILDEGQQKPRVDLDDDIRRFPNGLTTAEAEARLARFGPNRLVEVKQSELMKFLGNFWGPMPIMIWIAIIVEAVQKDWVDFFVLLALQLLNGCVSYYEEKNAGDAIAALKDKMSPKCSCKRDGVWDTEFDTGILVPGDLVQLKLGDIVPADSKLLGKGLQCLEIDQAALTGESLPVTMFPDDIAKMGATIKKGELDARVAFTGSDTFFGKAAALMASVESVGRFQKVLFKITMFLLLLSIVLVAIILVVLLEARIEALKAIGICVVLLVASIPIAMQVVSTSTMAVGSRRLAQKKVIVARLSAIEELAGMDMLCSDKTGTLTQNKLTLFEPLFPTAEGDLSAKTKELYLHSALAVKQDNREQQDEEVRRANVQFSMLEDRAIDKSGAVKQTLDAIDWCIYKRAKVGNAAELQRYTERKHNPFDPSNKRTESKVQDEQGNVMWVVKGAPQVVLEMCLNNTSMAAAQRESLKQKVGADIQDLADRGYRALGVAKAPGAKVDSDGEEAALQWTFTGVLSLADPPREDTLETIERAYEHGVEVKMVTGDQTAIAKETCRKLNMGTNILPSEELAAAERNGTAKDLVRNADGFAEVFPETKFRIVEILQEQGFTCGMTGDGVNDAPALKKAQIGIAVSGATDAARAAADIVLVEDGLSVIIDAILRSRKIFQRVRNYGIYRVACTIQLVFFFFFAVSFLHPSDYYCSDNVNDIERPTGGNIMCTQYRDPNTLCGEDAGDYGSSGGKNCQAIPTGCSSKCWKRLNGTFTYQYNNDKECPNVYPGAAYRFTLPVLAIVIITILNDVSIITIARDKVIPNKTPQQWQLPQLCTVSAILGFVPCLSSILLLIAGFSSADGYDSQFSKMLGRHPDNILADGSNASVKFLPYDELLMLLYLKISVSDFLTVFSARTRYWFFERRPGYALGAAFIFATTTSTLIATLATIPDTTYKMKPITGKAAGIVWAYNLIWFIVQDIAKLIAYWCFDKLNESSTQKEEERLRAIRSRRACVLEEAAVSQRNDIRASGALAPGGSALRGSFLGIAAAAGGSGALGSLGSSGAATDAVLEAAHKRIKALEASQATMARQIAELQQALKK